MTWCSLIASQCVGWVERSETHHYSHWSRLMGIASLHPSYDLRWYPVHRADLVAIEIAQISQIEFTRAAFANARRVFAGRAAIGEARCVPGVSLFGRTRRKADGAAVGMCRRLAVDRLRHREHAGLGEVENAVAIHLGRPDIQRAEQGIIERLGLFQVVGADHHMRKHSSIPPRFFSTNSRDCFALS